MAKSKSKSSAGFLLLTLVALLLMASAFLFFLGDGVVTQFKSVEEKVIITGYDLIFKGQGIKEAVVPALLVAFIFLCLGSFGILLSMVLTKEIKARSMILLISAGFLICGGVLFFFAREFAGLVEDPNAIISPLKFSLGYGIIIGAICSIASGALAGITGVISLFK